MHCDYVLSKTSFRSCSRLHFPFVQIPPIVQNSTLVQRALLVQNALLVQSALSVSMVECLYVDTVSRAQFLFADTVSTAKFLFVDTVSTAQLLFVDTVSTAQFLFVDTVSTNILFLTIYREEDVPQPFYHSEISPLDYQEKIGEMHDHLPFLSLQSCKSGFI